MIQLPRRVGWLEVTWAGMYDWHAAAIAGYDALKITVHPFFRPDKRWSKYRRVYFRGGDRTKHSTTLGAAVGEMVEALG